ncbi:hypothetical protein EJ07DRAFT_159945 [Lizonia empirigonia]|nr:hypothetical protein EJ07DRAFT_159945 [Lizonia empirigonia]
MHYSAMQHNTPQHPNAAQRKVAQSTQPLPLSSPSRQSQSPHNLPTPNPKVKSQKRDMHDPVAHGMGRGSWGSWGSKFLESSSVSEFLGVAALARLRDVGCPAAVRWGEQERVKGMAVEKSQMKTLQLEGNSVNRTGWTNKEEQDVAYCLQIPSTQMRAFDGTVKA